MKLFYMFPKLGWQQRGLSVNIQRWNHRILEKTFNTSNPTINPYSPQNHVLKCYIHMFFEHLQRWRLYHCPGQSVPMFYYPFCEKMISNISSKPLLAQLGTFPLMPAAHALLKHCWLWMIVPWDSLIPNQEFSSLVGRGGRRFFLVMLCLLQGSVHT